MVSAENGELCLYAKPNPLWDPALKAWFSDFLDSLGVAADAWFRRRQLGVYTEFEWEGSIPFHVEGAVPQDAPTRVLTEADGADHEDLFAQRRSRLDPVLDVYGQWLRRRSARRLSRFDELLRCPDCSGSLRPAADGYACVACGRKFKRDSHGVVYLLPSQT